MRERKPSQSLMARQPPTAFCTISKHEAFSGCIMSPSSGSARSRMSSRPSFAFERGSSPERRSVSSIERSVSFVSFLSSEDTARCAP